jgi:hypothetical protein
MRDYSVVTPAFWIGTTGKQLRGNIEAQLLAVYLMTSPHSTMTGVFHCPILYMAHETGLSFEGATKALASLCEAGFCEYEAALETVFVYRMASFQIGQSLKPNDNRIKGVEKDVEKMVSPSQKAKFLKLYSQAFSLSPLEAPPKPRTRTGTRTGTREDSAEPQSDSTPAIPETPVVLIPLNDNSEYPIGQTLIDEWSQTFPAVNVVQELREMRVWCLANPNKRKTRRGVDSFAVRWFGKEQDRGGSSHSNSRTEIGAFL